MRRVANLCGTRSQAAVRSRARACRCIARALGPSGARRGGCHVPVRVHSRRTASGGVAQVWACAAGPQLVRRGECEPGAVPAGAAQVAGVPARDGTPCAGSDVCCAVTDSAGDDMPAQVAVRPRPEPCSGSRVCAARVRRARPGVVSLDAAQVVRASHRTGLVRRVPNLCGAVAECAEGAPRCVVARVRCAGSVVRGGPGPTATAARPAPGLSGERDARDGRPWECRSGSPATDEEPEVRP